MNNKKTLTKKIFPSILCLFVFLFFLWGYLFVFVHIVGDVFDLHNQEIKKIPAYIPKVFLKNNKIRLMQNQESFTKKIKKIDIIEKEMKKLFLDKSIEQAIIFCFDQSKDLIKCDQKKNHYYLNVTKGKGTETSVEIDVAKIQQLESKNQDYHFFINVHNHPYGKKKNSTPIQLPSEADLIASENIQHQFRSRYLFSLVWADWKLWADSKPEPIFDFFPFIGKNKISTSTVEYFDKTTQKNKDYQVSLIFDFFNIVEGKIYSAYI